MGRRLALISDIHGNILALRSVMEDILNKKIGVEDIYCLGDLVGYGPRPNEVVELIKAYHIQTILGNYDEAVGFYLPSCGCNINSENDKIKTQNSLQWTAQETTEDNKQFLRELEEQITVEIDGHKILLTHGSPDSINDYVYEGDQERQQEIIEELEEEILLFGHTHFPYYKQMGNKLLINAGSVGRPKDGDNRACYCIVTLGERITVEYVRIAYDVEQVAKEIEESALLNIFAQILRSGRNLE